MQMLNINSIKFTSHNSQQQIPTDFSEVKAIFPWHSLKSLSSVFVKSVRSPSAWLGLLTPGLLRDFAGTFSTGLHAPEDGGR